MTFIKRVSDSVPIFSPEPPTQEPVQSQVVMNLGIANNADLFEAPVPNNFEIAQQQNIPLMQESSTPEITVDASSLFNYVEQTQPQPDARLLELKGRLNSIN